VAKLDLKQLKKELLKKQREAKRAKQQSVAQTAMQNKNDRLEHDLFREAMSGVTPLSHDKVFQQRKKTKLKPERHNDTKEFVVHDPISDELEVEEVDSAAILSFCRPGIQKSVFRKLRNGSYRISDELDLHGLTLRQAKKILLYYLQEAVQFEGCCIRIIHGKGHRSSKNKPVLKTHVNHWLREHERVLAFHSTKPKDGGSGAVYVLLKT